MAFSMKVPWVVLGVEKEGDVYVGAKVLPMGWSSAVGVLQHAHRRLALRSPLAGAGLLGRCEIRRDAIFRDLEKEDALWSLYLDDSNLIEVMSKKVAKELEGRPSDEQEHLRRAYRHWGIPVSLDKALVRANSAEKLGAVIDGDGGILKTSTRRALESLSLGFWLLRQDVVPRKSLQVFLGKEVHTLQFRRPLFGVLDYAWKDISNGEVMTQLGGKTVEEILLCGMSQPLRATDLRAKLHEVVTASDASESGGGMVYGSKLSTEGLKEIHALEEGLDEPFAGPVNLDEKQTILVLDFFAGIGGLSRALQLAKIPVSRLVVIEQDVECRRLNAARWPGCDLVVDIRKLGRKELERILRSVPGLTGVIAAGGSPCQGLSKLSVNRQHLEDPRSQLFYKFSELLGVVDELCDELKVWCIAMLENVIGDDADIEEMSKELGAPPIMVCASTLSRVRRPRLYWANVALEDHPSYTWAQHRLYSEVVFEESPEPLEKVVDAGWTWPAGESDDQQKLPTFTRAIPRKRPPAQPAGLLKCDEATVARWKGDQMKYPPYTYQHQFLFSSKESPETKRVASVTERERLMGFPTGYTKAMFKKEAVTAEEAEQQKTKREAALGNSFHAVVVACLMDLWLWAKGIRTDPMWAQAIVTEWHAAMGEPELGDYGPPVASNAASPDTPLTELEEEEAIMALEKDDRRAEWLRLSGHHGAKTETVNPLNVRLVHHFLRRAEFRGSDVRLDLGLVWRPDTIARTSINPKRWIWKVGQSYKWLRREHINLLELRAILRTFRDCRFLHLSDSQICISVLTKGRSSSRKINRILRKIAALCLALNIYPLYAWIQSRLNPADAPSRRHATAD